jgi:hypothetical protein
MMKSMLIAAAVTALAGTSTFAQTPQSGPNKAETNCTTSSTASGSGQTTGSSGNAMAMEKSAILPSAGNHANSAAPTVQSDGKPMQVRPDCPPDQAKPTK